MTDFDDDENAADLYLESNDQADPEKQVEKPSAKSTAKQKQMKMVLAAGGGILAIGVLFTGYTMFSTPKRPENTRRAEVQPYGGNGAVRQQIYGGAPAAAAQSPQAPAAMTAQPVSQPWQQQYPATQTSGGQEGGWTPGQQGQAQSIQQPQQSQQQPQPQQQAEAQAQAQAPEMTPGATKPQANTEAEIQAILVHLDQMDAELKVLTALVKKEPHEIHEEPKAIDHSRYRRHSSDAIQQHEDTQTAKEATPATLPSCKLIGIAPGGTMAWISCSGKTSIYKIGDALPGGASIKAIDANGFSVSTSSGIIQ